MCAVDLLVGVALLKADVYGLRRDLQQGQSLVDGQAADQVDDAACLQRGDPHEAGTREGTRLVAEQGVAAGADALPFGGGHRRRPFRSSLM